MIKILGPFEAPADVGEGKPRAVLARLALDGGSVVPAHELVEDIWGASPPPSAPKVLQAHVSALRKALGRSAIETRGGGYALRTETDLEQFEELAARAAASRTSLSARVCFATRSALAGRAAGGDPASRSRARAVARLNELRLEVLSRRIDAELELGEDESLVRELHALVQREPLREQPRAQLMRALYRAGRQAEALVRLSRRPQRCSCPSSGSSRARSCRSSSARSSTRTRHSPRAPSEPRDVVVCVGVAPVQLLGPLERELVVVELAAGLVAAARRSRASDPRRSRRAIPWRTRVRLAVEQSAELLVVRDAPAELLAAAPCDVALSNGVDELGEGPIAVAVRRRARGVARARARQRGSPAPIAARSGSSAPKPATAGATRAARSPARRSPCSGSPASPS